MKETFDSESKKALVLYRIERAHETLKEAKYNAEGGFYNAAVNRLYYACFYAVLALLLQNDIQTNTHRGARTMLGLHFVSKGILSKEDGKTFSDLFEKRTSGDYDDFVSYDKDMIDELYPRAEKFISDIEKLLK